MSKTLCHTFSVIDERIRASEFGEVKSLVSRLGQSSARPDFGLIFRTKNRKTLTSSIVLLLPSSTPLSNDTLAPGYEDDSRTLTCLVNGRRRFSRGGTRPDRRQLSPPLSRQESVRPAPRDQLEGSAFRVAYR